MAFDNNHPNRKDWRRAFRKAKAAARGCRNHGTCPYCQGNRHHKHDKRELSATEQINEH